MLYILTSSNLVSKWQNDARESGNCEVRTAINHPITSESSELLKHSPTIEIYPPMTSETSEELKLEKKRRKIIHLFIPIVSL